MLPWEPEAIEDVICSYGNDVTRHGCFRALRAFYNFVVSRYDVAIPSPIEKVIAPKVKKREKPTLSDQQLAELLNHGCREDLHVMLHLLVATAIRLGEAVNLAPADVYSDSIRVRGKTGERIIPVDARVLDMLHELGPGKYNAPPDRYFSVKIRRWSQRVSELFRKLNIPGSAHTLRHTFATQWRGSDSALKYILGHSSWAMVEHYRHQKDARALREYEVHSPIKRIFGDKAPDNQPDIFHEVRRTVDSLPGEFPGDPNVSDDAIEPNHGMDVWPPQNDDDWRVWMEAASNGRVTWLPNDEAHPALVTAMLKDTFRGEVVEGSEYWETLKLFSLSLLDDYTHWDMTDWVNCVISFDDGYRAASGRMRNDG